MTNRARAKCECSHLNNYILYEHHIALRFEAITSNYRTFSSHSFVVVSTVAFFYFYFYRLHVDDIHKLHITYDDKNLCTKILYQSCVIVVCTVSITPSGIFANESSMVRRNLKATQTKYRQRENLLKLTHNINLLMCV